jgi:hypothetical protein
VPLATTGANESQIGTGPLGHLPRSVVTARFTVSGLRAATKALLLLESHCYPLIKRPFHLLTKTSFTSTG